MGRSPRDHHTAKEGTASPCTASSRSPSPSPPPRSPSAPGRSRSRRATPAPRHAAHATATEVAQGRCGRRSDQRCLTLKEARKIVKGNGTYIGTDDLGARYYHWAGKGNVRTLDISVLGSCTDLVVVDRRRGATTYWVTTPAGPRTRPDEQPRAPPPSRVGAPLGVSTRATRVAHPGLLPTTLVPGRAWVPWRQTLHRASGCALGQPVERSHEHPQVVVSEIGFRPGIDRSRAEGRARARVHHGGGSDAPARSGLGRRAVVGP